MKEKEFFKNVCVEFMDNNLLFFVCLTCLQSMTSIRRPSQMMDTLPPYVYDTTMDPKLRFRLIEKEMNEQARVVQDLK